jgi:hypothetical protein
LTKGDKGCKVLSFFGLVFGLFLMSVHTQALEFPRPVDAVNDVAEVIPRQYETQMNHLAKTVFDETGTALVVATFWRGSSALLKCRSSRPRSRPRSRQRSNSDPCPPFPLRGLVR